MRNNSRALKKVDQVEMTPKQTKSKSKRDKVYPLIGE